MFEQPFSRTRRDGSDWMNRKSQINKYIQQNGTKEYRYSILKILKAKINFLPNDDGDAEMPMSRFQEWFQDVKNGFDKNTFWLLLPNN